MSSTVDTVGDNKEFVLTDAGVDVTVYFVPDVAGRTSANDTATSKYFDTTGCAKQFELRANQSMSIISMTGTTMTDPITVILNKAHTEKFDLPVLTKMVIRAATAGTSVKIRVRGR